MPRANNEFSFLDNHAKTKIYRGEAKVIQYMSYSFFVAGLVCF